MLELFQLHKSERGAGCLRIQAEEAATPEFDVFAEFVNRAKKMTEFQNDQPNGVLVRLEKIEEQLQRITDQLTRIADALEVLSSVVQPPIKDRDAKLNIEAVCYNQAI
jgi:hypothetical protein